MAQQKMREEYLKGLFKYQSDKFAPFMDKHFMSIESQLVTHEQNQLDEHLKTTVKANIDEKINNYSMLVETPEQMQAAVTDVLSSNQVWNRQFSPAVQEMNNRKLKDDLVSEIAKWNIYNDPSTQEEKSMVLANLKDTKGMYKDLTQSERIKLVKESQSRIFQNNQTLKRENEVSKDTRFNNIFDKMNNETLTLRDIDNEMTIPEEGGGVPKKQLLDIKEGIQRKIESDLDLIINKNDKANNYLQFINTFIDDETDRQKAREYLAKAFKDNILSSQEASFLNKIKRETEDVEFNRTGMWLKSAINKIKEVFRGRKTSTDSDAALAIKQLINGVSKGKNPADVVKEIVYQSAIKKNPDLLNIPEGGELRMDAEGNIKIVAPDLNTRETGEGK